MGRFADALIPAIRDPESWVSEARAVLALSHAAPFPSPCPCLTGEQGALDPQHHFLSSLQGALGVFSGRGVRLVTPGKPTCAQAPHLGKAPQLQAGP